MNKLISVIIPIFNSEKYLKRCIDSILKQTYNNLEILLIDDGSTDTSKKICEEYTKLDDRVKVFSNKNLGAARARLYGLKLSTGEYISFVDSDDFLENNFYEYLINLINISSDVDIACIQCFDSLEQVEKEKKCILEDEKIFEDYFCQPNIRSCLWNKLYSKEVFKNIVIPDDIKNYGEDVWFIFNALGNSKKVIYSNIQLYHYTINDDSLSRRGLTIDVIKSCIKAHKMQIEYITLKYNMSNYLINLSKEKLYNSLIDLYDKINSKTNSKIITFLNYNAKKIIKEYGIKFLNNKRLLLKVVCIRYFSWIYIKLNIIKGEM